MRHHATPRRLALALSLLAACAPDDVGALDDEAIDAVRRGRRGGPAVQVEPDGSLSYRVDARGDAIPDFSNAGYRGGGVALPTVPVRVELRPPQGDATDEIQHAIEAVSARTPDAEGRRGAVLLRRGTYRVAGTLRIRASGVVLRGEGEATVLLATGRTQRTLVDVTGDDDRREVPGTRRDVADAYVPVGARELRLTSARGYAPGMRVTVRRPSTARWIHAIGMDRIPARDDGRAITQWAPGSKDLEFDRVVTAVRGDTITLDAPVTNALQREYGGAVVFAWRQPGRIREVGVESLTGVSEYRTARDEDHAWTFVSLRHVDDAWVRDLRGLHFGYALVLAGEGSRQVTVQDCDSREPISELDGGRRYTYCIDGGQLTLWLRVRARDGRHDFVTHATTVGPNVFLEAVAEEARSEAGPHHRWAVGTLFDNVRVTGPEGSLAAYDRGNQGTGHGWSGAQQVFWNSVTDELRCEVPPTASNWAIGCTARRRRGDCAWESPDRRVTPASLYRAQLAARLGPAALRALAR